MSKTSELQWVKVRAACVCGGRELRAGQVLQVSIEEFHALIRERLATPCGPGGRMMTATFAAADMSLGGAQ